MKFDIKKIYKSTVKQLEKHQVELSIALTAISLLAFMPDDEDGEASLLKELIEDIKESNEGWLNTLRACEKEHE